MSLLKLIRKGRLREAIVELPCTPNNSNLFAQYRQNERAFRFGTIDYSEYTQILNKIRAETIKAIVAYEDISAYQPPEVSANLTQGNEDLMVGLIKKYKKTNPGMANLAFGLLCQLKNWSDTRSFDPSYDEDQLILTNINYDIEDFLEMIDIDKKEKLLEKVSVIRDKIKDRIPSPKDLRVAYQLANNIGMNASWIASKLDAKSYVSVETRVSIAQEIENFLNNI